MGTTLPKWCPYGPGLDDEGWGGRFAPAVPECHEHCVACVSTGCPIPTHRPDWTLGYREIARGEDEGEFWLCPLCFDWYREALGLRLDPGASYPPTPSARVADPPV